MDIHIVSFVLVLICGLSLASKDRCDKGPASWCQNQEIATYCGVLQFCKIKFPGNFHPKENIKSIGNAVKVELYYETLCPGCRQFITTQLFPTHQKLNSDIMDIGLYPFGNAQEYPIDNKWDFKCQHGVEECKLNVVETCVIHLLLHPNLFMPFINCLETQPSMDNAKLCAKRMDLEWAPIEACFSGSEGNILQHQLALKTAALNPPHQYVPWIVVNGQHSDEIQNAASSNLLELVCKTYTGEKPQACNNDKCYK
jgi:interferon gamma-inducible protein 30